jgi:hypothetical protein
MTFEFCSKYGEGPNASALTLSRSVSFQVSVIKSNDSVTLACMRSYHVKYKSFLCYNFLVSVSRPTREAPKIAPNESQFV